ncbi:MAG: hypothetical protein ABSG33_08400 [Candidatus Bathyarchaeia archaeon]
MTDKPEKIHVQIKYGDVAQEFSAEPQEAWLLVNQFFKEFIPSFEIARKLWLSVDLGQLARDLNGVVAFSSEGTSLLPPKNKFTDFEALSVWLTAQHLGHELGMLSGDALSKEELQTRLGKSAKIVSTRLGELAKNGVVAKTADDKFRITAFGIVQAQREVLPKIRAKIKV